MKWEEMTDSPTLSYQEIPQEKSPINQEELHKQDINKPEVHWIYALQTHNNLIHVFFFPPLTSNKQAMVGSITNTERYCYGKISFVTIKMNTHNK